MVGDFVVGVNVGGDNVVGAEPEEDLLLALVAHAVGGRSTNPQSVLNYKLRHLSLHNAKVLV